MPKVNSTAIKSVRYRRGGVVVEFHESGIYRYDAPRSVAKMLRRSRSVGVDYNRHLKGQFPCQKVA